MTVGLRAVNPRLTRESQNGRDVGSRARPRLMRPGVGPNHVPRWIADDRVEPRVRQAPAVLPEKHFGELELPVKEPPRLGHGVGGGQILAGASGRQRA